LAFFLGASLTLGTVSAAIGRWAWQRDAGDWWKTDWRDTASFRGTVSEYLDAFLAIGAGHNLDWYSQDTAYELLDERERIVEAVEQGYGGTSTEWDMILGRGNSTAISRGPQAQTPSSVDPPEWEEPWKNNPDYFYENDKNVLYRIWEKEMVKYRTNDGLGLDALSSCGTLPEGYGFLLVFQDGKTRIWKDGAEIDVYANSIYTSDDQWFVPGYENFPAGAGVKDIAVQLAVRTKPIQSFQGNYDTGGSTSYNRMYWLYQDMEQAKTFYRNQIILFAVGLTLLATAFPLRKAKALADHKIAALTHPVPTELRFLLTVGLAALLVLGGGWGGGGWWYEFLYEGLHFYMAMELLRRLASRLDNVPLVLALFWLVWLIRNDHRHNPKEDRRSLWRWLTGAVRKRELSLPIQKRMNLQSVLTLCAAVLAVAEILSLLILLTIIGWPRPWVIWNLLTIPPLLALIFAGWQLRRTRRLARDFRRLTEQVEAIRSGNLSGPLDLPEDADLRKTAEALNDIQSGMETAIEERIKSERMKVELVSNVSHDLKTPLTSILSYAELLRQEPLEGAAADYARIIDEKAHRLKAMVGDVFEVSKAASGQLPVTLERLDLAKLLRQTLADMEAPIRQSGLTFKTDLPDAPVEIVADGKRLYRVFQNLIDNALRYAFPGSRVYLTLKAGGGQAEASLRNTSKDELPAGVDFTARFVRGDASRTDGGSGLGLSIANSFTGACGGSFRVETVADLFTAVVAFPLAGDEDKREA